MLAISYFFTLVVLAFSSLNNVAALIPTRESAKIYPDLIPGPGLPSLEELGLTSEQLYTTIPTIGKFSSSTSSNGREVFSRSAKYNSVCETYTTGNVDGVIACYDYLHSIGGNSCGVNGDKVRFCSSGDAQVTGSNISGTGSAASLCRDVASALLWIITNCNSGGRVGGSRAAGGNGFLIVGVEHL
ncbi:hypothetical protein BDN72DRAFT_900512 [Pluteus cervinus]|uniref:Uncharacterized protein n=1 Tax=Pluteus cervinus TaxID=181527 RepID=A0ACD3AJ60_9AGAR|nr:hypothetical protein BDN72DRAFT_900512 [Pluteus cervinus]